MASDPRGVAVSRRGCIRSAGVRRGCLVLFAVPVLLAVLLGVGLPLSGDWLHRRALAQVEDRLGPLEPSRFTHPAQRPHPLLGVAATVEFSEDEMVLLKDWMDDVPTDVLDEYLTSSVVEPGTLFYRCEGVRSDLDWALDRTSGSFGIDYSEIGSRFPPGHGRIPPLIRLVFLCGWTAQRQGDLKTAATDAVRLGRLASIHYAEPGSTDFLRGALAENGQHHLLRQILAHGPAVARPFTGLLEALPDAELHESYRKAMATEALLVILTSESVMEDLGLGTSSTPNRGSWLVRYAQRVLLSHAEGGGLSSIVGYLDAYGSSYEEMREALTLRIEEMNLIEKTRALLGPGDWRFPAIPRWIEDHRRLSRALLQAAAKQRDARQPCREIRQQMGDLLEFFETIDEAGGCRIHYVYGEEYLWPSKVRVVDNPVGDWWLPSPSSPMD